ncbi:MFS transporter [Sphingorhabdus sp. YGSMI21]|uniref:MFS transporter n=2 Tax=Sphingomonadaceae TaxID=41297 RepID=UPI0013DBB997|nr:MFS transporter [Sphingorhabdus sp. YGSMI21]
MQGIVAGLSLIAIPAWLAARGASPIEVGAFVGTAMLPWSLKLFNGLLMDRFTYRPMGRRRSWILVAQAMMMLTLFGLAIAAPSAGQIIILTGFCFTLNLCATFNDVAVDGMAVDLVPEEERTTINGIMFGSQTLGISASGFIAGQLLADDKISTMALLFGAFVAIASLFISLFRERPDERLFPWTSGQPSAECAARQHTAWLPILRGIFRSLLSSKILLFLTGMGLATATYAFTDSVAPILAVQQLGWGSDDYSSFASIVGLFAAIAGATMPALIVRWAGLRMTISVFFLILAIAAIVGGATLGNWESSTIFAAIFAVQYFASLFLTIALIVWAMRLCDPAIAASLFALFMAVPNLARSAMSGSFGWLIEASGYAAAYYAVAILSLGGLLFCLLAKVGVGAPAHEQENRLHR